MPRQKLVCIGCLAVAAVVLLVLVVRVFSMLPVVQSEVNATPSPTPLSGSVMVATPDPNAPAVTQLKKGSTGDEVIRLQQRLKELGYYEGEIDGSFGSGTEQAVILFQQDNELDADGIAGRQTQNLLYDDNTAGKPASRVWHHSSAQSSGSGQGSESLQLLTPIQLPGYIRQDGLPILVSAASPLPDDYETYDLVCLNDYCDASVVKIKYSDMWAEREAADALMTMLRAAQADGLKKWQISSAYRSREYQQQLLDKKIREYTKQGYSSSKARTKALGYVNAPGTSEHQTGLCFDITVPNTSSFGSTKQSKWLKQHAWEYGFVQRYPGNKSSITGINNEAWHYRWVGLEHAAIMHNENLCLEEYIARYGLIIEE